MSTVKIDPVAYYKVLAHSLKYPFASVNGILIGWKKDSEDDAEIQIADAIPLFHSHLSLSPLLDAALIQV